MSDLLVVLMGDRVAGELRRARDGRLRFTYDDEYRRLADPTPLSVAIPAQVRTHADHVVTPWLWGLLPDNERVLGTWARRFQVSAASPFGLLASPVGRDCAGAVRFVAPGELDAEVGRPGRIEWLTGADVESRFVQLREDPAAWLGRDFSGRFSLGGAQSKIALLLEGERWGLPSGRAPSTHILKPAIPGFTDHDLNEHLCQRAAALAGLPVARSEIRSFGAERVIVVERYDRTRSSGRLVRVHQEDLCQALGVSPSGKYQSDGGPTPQLIATTLRRTMPARVAETAVRYFADALIWNWLVLGTDAHAKNYALLLAGSQVRLAPFYDIASALPYGVHERELRLAMKFGRDYRPDMVRASTWPTLAGQLGLDPAEIVRRARRLIEDAPAAFETAVGETDSFGSELPTRLLAAVIDRAGRCARVLP